ncbi:hypothetical protein [Opitutus sp. ER46]|uniref:hypothetical protein n=1 Tax=Opitutus sp. ER46 TaxID=2161864 RepID=UPI0018EE5E8D|nr:hypothetical protein [Opitutus sp. ER46]
MSRLLLAFALLLSPLLGRAQEAPSLNGHIDGRFYVSPTGAFKVTIPVLPELGGNISDTGNVVTFQDAFNVHVSIAVFPQDATQRWEMSTRGTKDYLAYFFANFVLGDFRQSFPGVEAESAKFLPGTMDGALLAYLLIPGGSMFMNRVPALGPTERVPVAKRGNLVFVKNGDIFVISTELAERVIEGKTYKKTTAEEDQILRQRLEDVVSKMQFLKPAPAPKAPTSTTPAPAAAAPAPAPTPSTASPAPAK